MSKFSQLMKKNFLLLFRNRFSSAAILLGPLLIILLIGFAFSTPSSYDLAVGIEKMNNSTLTQRFVDNMEQQGFAIQEFDSIEECISLIEKGTLQTCISFPNDFEITNNKTNELVFHVDESRMNFVYQIIDSISSNIGVESAEISADLTEDIITLLFSTEKGIEDSIGDIIAMKADSEKSINDADKTKGLAEGINLEAQEVNTDELVKQFEDVLRYNEDLRDEAESIVNRGKNLVNTLDEEEYAGAADYSALNSALNELDDVIEDNENGVEAETSAFASALADVKDALEEYADQLSLANSARTDIITEISDFREEIDQVRNDLNDLKNDLESLNTKINELKVTSSEKISSPIITTIEPVTVSDNKLFYLFPYLLMLVTLFVGLILPATMIVIEKKSKSSFRTFCTPTKDHLFMITQFLTSFIILFVQVAIVLGISYYFLGDALLNNLMMSLFIILLSMIFYILLGMGLGYFFNSQEGVTIGSITISSIFLFLSNLVLPIETLGPQIKSLSLFNPYVLSSEMLRRSIFFSATFGNIQAELITLLSFSAILFVLIVIIRDIVKSKYYLHLAFMSNKNSLEKPSDLYLMIGNDIIKNPKDLLAWVKDADKETFDKEFDRKKTGVWLRKQHKISLLFSKKSQKKVVEMLEKRLK